MKLTKGELIFKLSSRTIAYDQNKKCVYMCTIDGDIRDNKMYLHSNE